MHKIVIIGGGAGGLELITKLGDSLGKSNQASILLIDKNITHIWKPLLHEVASGTLDHSDNEVNYYTHSHKHNYDYIYGELTSINKLDKTVNIETISSLNSDDRKIETIAYDTLILAIGSKSNDFKTRGVKEYCYFLDDQKSAKKIYKHITSSYIDIKNKFINIENDFNVSIIGAGATGVELISELSQLKKNMEETYFKETKDFNIKYTLIDASDCILPALSSGISKEASIILNNMGITILTNKIVSAVDSKKIYFSDGSEINSDLTIWTAGVKAPDIFEKLEDFEKDRINRLKVHATLQSFSDPNVFAFGDCASCQLDARSQPLAPRAQVASQQAEFLLQAMNCRLNNIPLPLFKFIEKGTIVSLSPKSAVGEVFSSLKIHGSFARKAYQTLYRVHQMNIHGLRDTILITQKDTLARKLLRKFH